MKNRLFSCLLAAALLVTALTLPARADDEILEGLADETTQAAETILPGLSEDPYACGENLTWELSGSTLTIRGSGRMDDFTGDAPWADHKDKIKFVVLDGKIENIGANAFKNYKKLESVSFGSSLREIGTSAFSGCDGLTQVELPATFRVFGEESFRSCHNLTKFVFAGGMPSFRLNCLWDTNAKLIYPANNPWPLVHIEQLETAFQGRIEFLASDGTDPYTPDEQKEEPEEKPTEKPAEKPTEKPTEETTVPTTVPTTEAASEPTMGQITEAPTEKTEPETTRELLPLFTEPQAPQEPHRGSGTKLWVILLVVLMVLSAAGIAVLAWRMYLDRKAGDDYDEPFDDDGFEGDDVEETSDDFSQLGRRTSEFVKNADQTLWEMPTQAPRQPQAPAEPREPQPPHRETLAQKEERRAAEKAAEAGKAHKKGGKFGK